MMTQPIYLPLRAMGKPTMTAADRWKKRPCILRYREYCDRVRGGIPNAPDPDGIRQVIVRAHFAMPKSWSVKKQREMCGQPHRTKPDWDNISKALMDALWPGCDEKIPGGDVLKFWSTEDLIEVRFRFEE